MRFKASAGSGSKVVTTRHASEPAPKRKRKHSVLKGVEDALADAAAAAGVLSMDARAPPGGRPKADDRLWNKTQRDASEASEETGEEHHAQAVFHVRWSGGPKVASVQRHDRLSLLRNIRKSYLDGRHNSARSY